MILIGLSFSTQADSRYELRVDGLACPYCAYGIEKKLKAIQQVDSSSLDVRLNDGLVIFNTKGSTKIEEAMLKRLINDSGFTLRGVETSKINLDEIK